MWKDNLVILTDHVLTYRASYKFYCVFIKKEQNAKFRDMSIGLPHYRPDLSYFLSRTVLQHVPENFIYV